MALTGESASRGGEADCSEVTGSGDHVSSGGSSAAPAGGLIATISEYPGDS